MTNENVKIDGICLNQENGICLIVGCVCSNSISHPLKCDRKDKDIFGRWKQYGKDKRQNN